MLLILISSIYSLYVVAVKKKTDAMEDDLHYHLYSKCVFII